MNLLGRIRIWLKSLVAASYGQKKLFVEQLEDRCFLSAVPMNDGSVMPVPNDAVDENPSELDSLQEEQGPRKQDDAVDVEREDAKLSPLELPLWAKQRIAESSGQFVEAFRLGEQGVIVHFRDSAGDSEVLYRDDALLQQVSLVEVIVNQLHLAGFGNQSVREIDELSVSVSQQNTQTQTEVEGVATLESPNGTTRLLGFTLRFAVVASATGDNADADNAGAVNGTRGSSIPFPFATDSPHRQASLVGPVSRDNIEVVGPQPPKSLFDPIYDDFANRFRADFWLPQTRLLEPIVEEDHESIPPHLLLPNLAFDSPQRDMSDPPLGSLNSPGNSFADDGLVEDGLDDWDTLEEAIIELNPAEDVLGRDPLDSILEDLLQDEIDSPLEPSPANESSDELPPEFEDSAAPDAVSIRNEYFPRPSHHRASRHDWPDAETENPWKPQDETEEADTRGKYLRDSVHAGDVNAFNVGPKASSSVDRDDTATTDDVATEAEAVESGDPKNPGGTRQEPTE